MILRLIVTLGMHSSTAMGDVFSLGVVGSLEPIMVFRDA